MSLRTATQLWGVHLVQRALDHATPARVTAELAAEVKRKARQRRSFLAWADDLPWERFCTVVAIVSGEIQP